MDKKLGPEVEDAEGGIPVERGKIVTRNTGVFERGKNLYDLVFRITCRFSHSLYNSFITDFLLSLINS